MGKFQKGNQAAKGIQKPEGFLKERKLTRLGLELIIQKYLHATADELKAILKEPGQTTVIELMVISIMARGMSGGDTQRAEFILNRLIGKVPDKVEVNDVTNKELAEEMKQNLIKAIRDGNGV